MARCSIMQHLSFFSYVYFVSFQFMEMGLFKMQLQDTRKVLNTNLGVWPAHNLV